MRIGDLDAVKEMLSDRSQYSVYFGIESGKYDLNIDTVIVENDEGAEVEMPFIRIGSLKGEEPKTEHSLEHLSDAEIEGEDLCSMQDLLRRYGIEWGREA